MTTVPRATRDAASRRRSPAVPPPRQPLDAEAAPGPDPTRQDLVREGAAALLGMVLLATLLGTVGGVALLWLATRMLEYLR